MLTTISIILLLALVVYAYLQLPLFGGNPPQQKSPNFRNKQFHNIEPTTLMVEGVKMTTLLYEQFFVKRARKKPKKPIPTQYTDLKNLNPNENILVWFGHSSYFMQINGIKFLIDPVLSGNASPIPGSVKAFAGTDIYQVKDLPEIDVLLISHDHYDHLDYPVIKELRHKVHKVICGLGVATHFKRWKYDMNKVVELDWNQKVTICQDLELHTFPARHSSGRKFNRENTLWLSFAIVSSNIKIYLGADSGYGKHFKAINEQIGRFDWAILDNGQYNKHWRYIHMHPDEVLQAAQDLQTAQLLPFHSCKFALAWHTWDEPLQRITQLYQEKEYPFKLNTPMIGEKVNLNSQSQTFRHWWQSVE